MKKNKNILTRRSFVGKTITLAAGLSLTGRKLWGSPTYIPNLLKHNSFVKNACWKKSAHFLGDSALNRSVWFSNRLIN